MPAAAAASALHHHDEAAWAVRPAPPPGELLWSNLGLVGCVWQDMWDWGLCCIVISGCRGLEGAGGGAVWPDVSVWGRGGAGAAAHNVADVLVLGYPLGADARSRPPLACYVPSHQSRPCSNHHDPSNYSTDQPPPNQPPPNRRPPLCAPQPPPSCGSRSGPWRCST